MRLVAQGLSDFVKNKIRSPDGRISPIEMLLFGPELQPQSRERWVSHPGRSQGDERMKGEGQAPTAKAPAPTAALPAMGTSSQWGGQLLPGAPLIPAINSNGSQKSW